MLAGGAGGSDPPDRDNMEQDPQPGGSKDDGTKRKAENEGSPSSNGPKRKTTESNGMLQGTLNFEQFVEEMVALSEQIPEDSVDPSDENDENEENEENDEDDENDELIENEEINGVNSPASYRSDTSYSSSDDDDDEPIIPVRQDRTQVAAKRMAYAMEVLNRPQPKHKWLMIPEILNRPIGTPNRLAGWAQFEKRVHGSLHVVQRLELMYKLERHSGCVNCINFNSTGNLLASCSDDKTVCLWNWATGRLKSQIRTFHTSNMFQAKFLPIPGHMDIVTCGRDGKVGYLEIDSDGSLRNSRKLAQHASSAHKISFIAGSPYCFLSCGEDAQVFSFDLRTTPSHRLLMVRNKRERIPLHSIDCHPIDANEFVVGGCDNKLRIYDRRHVKKPFWIRIPQKDSFLKGDAITCALYSHNGSEIVASYQNQILLWDRTNLENMDFVHKYVGHRNFTTIKGVAFFGPKSEYIVSGSDCSNIFVWDKESEAIVQWMAGDESGVVNCLESHPSVPVLATSGLDNDVKVWIPSSESNPTFDGLKSAVIRNTTDRGRCSNYMLVPIRMRLNGPMSSDDDEDGEEPNGLPLPCNPS